MIKNSNYILGHPRIHLISWGVFISWEVLFVGVFFGDFGHPFTYLAHYSLIIALFYSHVLWLLPWSLKNEKQAFWRIPIIFLTETALFIMLSFVTDKTLIRCGFIVAQTEFKLDFQYIIKTLYREIYFLGFSTGLYYLATYQQERKKTEDLEKSRLIATIESQRAQEEVIKANNAFLLAQINPHFFFNTLDYLYHNVLESSPNSAEAISVLATIMRFAIDADKVSEFIRLGDEIAQVENLVYLNQLREPLAIRLEIEEETKEIWLIPLVLLTLVENIFKHGNLKNFADGAVIKIWLSAESLHIETENLAQQKSDVNSTNNGLMNITSRLKHAYGDDVVFNYKLLESKKFKVSLIIPLSVLNCVGHFSYPSASIDKE